jgi:hypothetical protein
MAPPLTVGYAGRGTLLEYSLDNVTFTVLAQLQQFEPSGSKQTIIEQTNLSSPGNFAQFLAVQIDAGEISFSGVLNPEDLSYLTLLQLHGNMTLVYWWASLIDGSSFYFQAFVSEIVAFVAKWNKAYTFSGKLRLTGGMTSPLGTFDAATFDPLVFGAF